MTHHNEQAYDSRKKAAARDEGILEGRIKESKNAALIKVQAVADFAKKVEADLLAIADQGEYEDLRREVERYFSQLKETDNQMNQ